MASERNWTPEPWVADRAVDSKTGRESLAIYHYPHESHCIEIVESPSDAECIHGNMTETPEEAVANRDRIVACVNKLADFPDLDECVVVSRAEAGALWAPEDDVGNFCDVCDSYQRRVFGVCRTDMLKSHASGLVAVIESLQVEIAVLNNLEARIAVLEAELALRDRLEAAGICMWFETSFWRVRGPSYYSVHDTADAARAAAYANLPMTKKEGDDILISDLRPIRRDDEGLSSEDLIRRLRDE